MDIVSRIRSLAENQSLNLAELERRLDFSQGSIRKWNTSTPGVDKLEKLAEYFDVSTDYLLGRESYEQMKMDQARRDFSDEGATEYFYAIQRNAKKLDEKDQKKLFDIMQTVFDNVEELEDDDEGYL